MTSRRSFWRRFRSGFDLYYGNLLALLLLGVTTLWWLGRYTDHLASVLGLLSLGGALAWIGFLANVIRARRKEHLQLALEGLLRQRFTSFAIAAVALMVVFFTVPRASITFDSRLDDSFRRVGIRTTTGGKAVEAQLYPGAVKTLSLYTGISSTAFEIDVDGLPLLTGTLGPLERESILVPNRLRSRNAVLFQPTPVLSRTAFKQAHAFALTVLLNGKGIGRTPFSGQCVWVGCRADVDVPDNLRDEWRLQLAGEKDEHDILTHWLGTSAVGESIELTGGDSLEFQVLKGDGELWRTKVVTVLSVRRPEDFPHVVEMDAKSGEE